MPKNRLDGIPFPPLLTLEQDTPIRIEQIQELFSKYSQNSAISILIRSKSGHPKRGGITST